MTRRQRGRGRWAALAALAIVALTAQTAATPSDASWNDREWVHAAARTSDCTQPSGQVTARGEGRMLSGRALGIDLDTIAAVRGVTATNDGNRSLVSPAGTPSVGPDAYADPLSVSALNATIDLGTLLYLPLDTPAGVIGQYARAQNDGHAAGAAGLLTSGGAINTAAAGDYPRLATISLSGLLNSVGRDLGTVAAGVADASIEVGAVAGRATVDGCAMAWGVQTALREYLLASLHTRLQSDTVGAVHTQLQDVVTALTNAVNGLSGDAGLLDLLTDGVLGLIGALGLASAEVTLTASLDPARINSILSTPIRDGDGTAPPIIDIDLGAGTVTIDTVALFNRAYPDDSGAFANALPPNYNPLSDPAALSKLSEVLTDTLDDWLTSLTDRLLSAVYLTVVVAVKVTVPVVGTTLLQTSLTVSGHLDSLVVAPTSISLLNALVAALPGIIENAVTPILQTAIGAPVALLGPLLDAVATTVTALYNGLFASGLVAVTVNAQNDPTHGFPEPDEWSDLPPRMFSVAALRIGVLDAAGNANVPLYLARGTVGPTCSMTAAPTQCPGY